ncbi:hypothetical protein Ae263Ps1_1725c [Pseudonocardia sp. Ae263_Ps1]|nr:hypothetical protein Ae150APs1_3599 [Pseudonocardia sp. Ae150A_Ps1]OLL84670.1 hypothetical protein Ae263Ps1_1725c [Pseudonocardia sp. Ae263_Ps1]
MPARAGIRSAGVSRSCTAGSRHAQLRYATFGPISGVTGDGDAQFSLAPS